MKSLLKSLLNSKTETNINTSLYYEIKAEIFYILNEPKRTKTNFIIDCNMEDKFSELQDKFLCLANLKQGEKLCVKSWTCVEKSSIYGAIVRKWNGETRTLTVQVLDRVFTKAQKYIRKMSVDQLFPIETLLKSSSIGLSNLTASYKSDPDMCSKLADLTSKLTRLQKLVELRREMFASIPHLTPVSPRPFTMSDTAFSTQQEHSSFPAPPIVFHSNLNSNFNPNESLIQSELYYSTYDPDSKHQ